MQNVTRKQSSPPGLLHLSRGCLLKSINLHLPVLLEGGAIPFSFQNQINKIHASLFSISTQPGKQDQEELSHCVMFFLDEKCVMNRNIPWICLGLGALKFVPNAKVKLAGNSQGNPPEHGIPNLKLPMTFHFITLLSLFFVGVVKAYIGLWLLLIAVVQGNHIHSLIRTYYPSTCKCFDQKN